MGRWYKLTKFFDDQERVLAEIGEDGKPPEPVYLHAQFFDEDGKPVLTIVRCDMACVPLAAIQRLQGALEAAQLTPVLVLPQQVELVRLEELTGTQAERARQRLTRQRLSVVDGGGGDQPR